MLLASPATPTCQGYAFDYVSNTYTSYIYDSLLSSIRIDLKYVVFCAYVSPQVFFLSYTFPTPVFLYCLVRAENIVSFVSRMLFRPPLLLRVAVIRCAPI